MKKLLKRVSYSLKMSLIAFKSAWQDFEGEVAEVERPDIAIVVCKGKVRRFVGDSAGWKEHWRANRGAELFINGVSKGKS